MASSRLCIPIFLFQRTWPSTAPKTHNVERSNTMSNFVQNKLNNIVQGFIDELEKGTAPWIKPYEGGDVMSLPKNRYSRRRYKGLNTLILWEAMNRNGWSEPYFITYKQCQMFEGAHVKAGEKGTTVIYWGPKDGDDEQVDTETGEVKPTFIR